jgi:hypothetical protein
MRAALVQHLRARPTPRVEFGSLHETLIIASVATILVIRRQLWLTHDPQLGGHGSHVAHLLWGGLFMLLGTGLLLTFLRTPVLSAGGIVGGVGFGFVIDELGKFVTEDTNYFYRSFEHALFVAILGTQVFSFVESQSGAVVGQAVALLLFVALRAVRSNDRAAHADAVPAPRGVAPPLRPVSAGP